MRVVSEGGPATIRGGAPSSPAIRAPDSPICERGSPPRPRGLTCNQGPCARHISGGRRRGALRDEQVADPHQ
jgi:hypothetical protein